MVLPDVNVLIYAFRSDTDHHTHCRSWLEAVIASDEPFAITPLVLSAVARIATNPRIFVEPSGLNETFAFCDALLDQPHCERVEPGGQHWSIFRKLCLETGTRGPKVSDAWLAALAIEHRCTFVTFDRDFARFPGLLWRLPEIAA